MSVNEPRGGGSGAVVAIVAVVAVVAIILLFMFWGGEDGSGNGDVNIEVPELPEGGGGTG